MGRDMRFPIMWYVRPAKHQISLRIRAVCSELEPSMSVKLLTKHHLEFLSLKETTQAQLSMVFILFINVKKCWHLNSIFKIGEFLHVNKKTFTFKLTF